MLKGRWGWPRRAAWNGVTSERAANNRLVFLFYDRGLAAAFAENALAKKHPKRLAEKGREPFLYFHKKRPWEKTA